MRNSIQPTGPCKYMYSLPTWVLQISSINNHLHTLQQPSLLICAFKKATWTDLIVNSTTNWFMQVILTALCFPWMPCYRVYMLSYPHDKKIGISVQCPLFKYLNNQPPPNHSCFSRPLQSDECQSSSVMIIISKVIAMRDLWNSSQLQNTLSCKSHFR